MDVLITLLRYAYSISRRFTLYLLSITVAGSGVTVLVAYLLGRLVGQAAQVAGNGPLVGFILTTAAMAAAFLADSLLPVLRRVVATALEMRVGRWNAQEVLEPMLTPPRIDHLADSAVQDAYGGATTEAPIELRLGPTFAASILGNRVTLLGSALLLVALFHWWVPIVLVLSNVLVERHLVRVLERGGELWRGRTEGHRHASYVFDLALSAAAKEIRIFGLTEWMAGRYLSSLRGALEPVWMRRRRDSWRDVIVLLPHIAVCGAAMILAVKDEYDGRLALSATVTVLSAIGVIGTGVGSGSVRNVRHALQAYRSVRELRTGTERQDLAGSRSHDLSDAPREAIRFENVSFRYPGAEQDVLHDLDLTMCAGESLAVVGVNGAGKSTFVALLTGCRAPTGGRITVDGVDLASLDATSLGIWQRRFATITQEFLRLPLPARDNVALGSGGDIGRAVERAGVADVIESLPEGWNTTLDKSYEGGVDLSGGEWQRIALARALRAVDAGAGILVLDEPAAALDVRSEAMMVDRYLDLTAGLTSLIISHRFSVVRQARRICVLDHGRIVESGTHDELITAGGTYARMFHVQAGHYADWGSADA